MQIHFQENWEKTHYESDHILTLGNHSIPYHTVCEDNFFYDEEGKCRSDHLFLRLLQKRRPESVGAPGIIRLQRRPRLRKPLAALRARGPKAREVRR